MAKGKGINGLLFGYFAIVLVAIAITGLSISVWSKPYQSTQNTVTAITKAVSDTTQALIITDNANNLFEDSNQVDTLAINATFLQRMRENGELLTADEFASRITDYYNTLVAVLTALFVLFTVVTYLTIKSKFEGKFEDKARELETNQRQRIIDELRSMLNDSKKIDEVITSAIGGHIDDKIATKEEVDYLSSDMETFGERIFSLTTNLEDIKKKQDELFKVLTELQDQISDDATVCIDSVKEDSVMSTNPEDETPHSDSVLDSEHITTE